MRKVACGYVCAASIYSFTCLLWLPMEMTSCQVITVCSTTNYFIRGNVFHLKTRLNALVESITFPRLRNFGYLRLRQRVDIVVNLRPLTLAS